MKCRRLQEHRRWARGARGPVSAKEWEGEPITCYVTGETLRYVKRHVRKAHARGDGTAVRASTVQAHFRGGSDNWSNMSIEHKAAQHKIELAFAIGKPYTYEYEGIPFELPTSVQVALEQRWGDYVLDVGFSSAGGVVAAVEILKTHMVDDAKARDLTAAVPWVEVLAEDVLREDHGARLTAVNCGSRYVAAARACSAAAGASEHAAIVASRRVLDIADVAVRVAWRAAFGADHLIRRGCSLQKKCGVCRSEFDVFVLWRSCDHHRRLCSTCKEEFPPMCTGIACGSCGLFIAATHGGRCDLCVKYGASVGITAPSKYAGRTLGQIWKIDKPYVRLLSGTRHDGRAVTNKMLQKIYACSSRTLRSSARKIMYGKCHGCFDCPGWWGNGVPKKLCKACWKRQAKIAES